MDLDASNGGDVTIAMEAGLQAAFQCVLEGLAPTGGFVGASAIGALIAGPASHFFAASVPAMYCSLMVTILQPDRNVPASPRAATYFSGWRVAHEGMTA
jgi:hypothetical protein